jgi:hypothetical protein
MRGLPRPQAMAILDLPSFDLEACLQLPTMPHYSQSINGTPQQDRCHLVPYALVPQASVGPEPPVANRLEFTPSSSQPGLISTRLGRVEARIVRPQTLCVAAKTAVQHRGVPHHRHPPGNCRRFVFFSAPHGRIDMLRLFWILFPPDHFL